MERKDYKASATPSVPVVPLHVPGHMCSDGLDREFGFERDIQEGLNLLQGATAAYGNDPGLNKLTSHVADLMTSRDHECCALLTE